MIGSLLIANRGEIARRIIRTARRLGVRTVAVFSESDAGAPHVAEADEALPIGASPARESYLAADAILAAARRSGAEAIHPGYGFLSENADFAQAVIDAGLVWVGPPPAAIRAMGRKDAAKRLMREAGVPVTPGYLGEDQSPQRLAAEAAAIGWPVLIKAVAGGGGKGMRRVDRAQDFGAALEGARREAKSAFGDDRVLLERYVSRPRHIEVQVFGDVHGEVVHLFERDCSAQRRHQKVVEEAPAPGLSAAVREALCAAAVRAARAVDYVGAGTVEFIADASEGLRSGRIWFMEMNTRLQVEHPVTEAITGLDLVEWQLRVASGEPLPLRQNEITMNGCAVEARLYAEDPARGFLPSTGPLSLLAFPGSVRVDSGVVAGGEITTFYDPMIAKLIAHAPTRARAIAELAGACAAVQIWPVRSNAGFLARLLARPEFVEGGIDTGLIEAAGAELTARPGPTPDVLWRAAQALLRQAAPEAGSPWTDLRGLRLNGPARAQVRLQLDGDCYAVDALEDVAGVADRTGAVTASGHIVVFAGGEAYAFTPPTPQGGQASGAGDGLILAPMPGRIVSVDVRVGDSVRRGQTLVILEAMKMEHALVAHFDAKVAQVRCAPADQVGEGALLIRLEAAG
ncbi:MAG TPA: biotin carboxylase N-terminal domain-containing protein [Caulobacteraceae bacterium]|nr:biotin carboxylase N-terminal domain-containing protein [Caulobacteraceae bacterium]